MVGAQVLYVCSSQKLKEFSFGPRGTKQNLTQIVKLFDNLRCLLSDAKVTSPLVHLLLSLDKYLLRFH